MEHAILEIQQCTDAKVFRKHYCHEEEELQAALEFGSAPTNLFPPACLSGGGTPAETSREQGQGSGGTLLSQPPADDDAMNSGCKEGDGGTSQSNGSHQQGRCPQPTPNA